MKDIKEELYKWRKIPYSWTENSLLIAKMSILCNLIYRFNAIQIKILASYFVNINKLIIKFIKRSNRPRIANSILKKDEVR